MQGWIRGTLCGLMMFAACVVGGCATPPQAGGGGGGGNNEPEDPLPEIQLGQDESLDANIAAITAADNAALNCINLGMPFDNEEVLLDLKRGYVTNPQDAASFEAFVADFVIIEEAKQQQICETEIGDSETLDANLQRIVSATAEAAECNESVNVRTTEQALDEVKLSFFQRVIDDTDLITFSTSAADDSEEQATEVCDAAG